MASDRQRQRSTCVKRRNVDYKLRFSGRCVLALHSLQCPCHSACCGPVSGNTDFLSAHTACSVMFWSNC